MLQICNALITQVFGHGLLALTLRQRARQFDVENQARVTAFYMFIWKVILLVHMCLQSLQLSN